MPTFTHHIFICTNQRSPGHRRGCCDPEGTEELRNAFKAEIKSRKLGPLVRANKAGCLEQCEHGPTVVIYPQGIFYGHVTVADVPRIIEQTAPETTAAASLPQSSPPRPELSRDPRPDRS